MVNGDDVSPRKRRQSKLEKPDRFAVLDERMRTDEEIQVHRRADRLRAAPGRGGTPPADVCRQLGVSEATFYIWKKKYAHLGVSELRKL
jgi:transposase